MRNQETEWVRAYTAFDSGAVKPEDFAKDVGTFFWMYYFSVAFATYTNGLPTISDAAFKNKKLKFSSMKFNTKNLASLVSEYSKTTASAFHGASNNEGKKGPLTDGPTTKLGSAPALEHRILSGKERLWWDPSTKVIFTTSGHLDTTAPGKKVHENLVKEVKGLGTGSTTVAYCALPEFAGQLFSIK